MAKGEGAGMPPPPPPPPQRGGRGPPQSEEEEVMKVTLVRANGGRGNGEGGPDTLAIHAS